MDLAHHVIFNARKRSLGQGNVFTPVCHSVHRGEGGLSNPPMQIPQGWADPLDAEPPRCRPPGLGRPPAGWADPQRAGQTPHPPPIRSTSGRYASYWNAYLFKAGVNLQMSHLGLETSPVFC